MGIKQRRGSHPVDRMGGDGAVRSQRTRRGPASLRDSVDTPAASPSAPSLREARPWSRSDRYSKAEAKTDCPEVEGPAGLR